ncbi:hypothetical protein B0T10DRAFT_462602 [Thelonectria olida]|uniref:Nephrocystin 3-like N-terminal domain-containing protein n=1 Tax=Thelonectria olida TaxID=1576542 RepID=A0A9P8VZJ3_9HYPO|nr:hypothetical protein B0T10DRAFT_462602 [Thelonectria olida]
MKETEIRALFDRLEREKSTLGMMMGMVHSKQQRNLGLNIQELKALNWLPTAKEACLRALFETDPSQDRENIIDTRGEISEGTCEWITTTEEYKTWEQTSPYLLWISAPPGSGKTYIATYLSRLLERPSNDGSDTKSIFFFCDNKEKSRNSATSILRGLMYQLIQHKEDLLKLLLPHWKIQHEALFSVNSLNALWKLFQAMVTTLGSTIVFCIIDALDECEETSLQKLLRKFEALGKRSEDAATNLRFIVTSRRYPRQIEESLSSFLQLRLDRKAAAKEDVERYLSERVLELARKKQIVHSGLHHQIEEIFRQRSEQSFLWVSFVAQELETKLVGQVEVSLGQLPQGLNAIYERILSQIDSKKTNVISDMLGWITLAERPLSVLELCDALSSSPVNSDPISDDGDEHVHKSTNLRRTLSGEGGLGTRTQDGQREPDDEPQRPKNHYWNLRVTFIHKSAKDYLLNLPKADSLGVKIQDPRQLHETIFHTLIGSICKNLLDGDWNNLSEFHHSSKDAIVLYALYFWDFHLEKLEDIAGAIQRHPHFFKKSVVRAKWAKLLSRNLREKPNDPIPLLHLACNLGMYRFAACLLERKKVRIQLGLNRDLHQKWGETERTPLHWACSQGHADISTLLLDFGADPSVSDKTGMSALDQALIRGDLDVFRSIEETKRGRKLLRQARNSTLPMGLLHYAAVGGSEEACRTLIEKHGFDLESVSFRRTPLASAIAWGNLDLARFLVSDLNAKTSDGYRLLCAATDARNREEVDDSNRAMDFIISELKVDVNSVNELGENIVHDIFRANDWREICLILEMAIDLGANPGHGDNNGWNPHYQQELHLHRD